MNFSSHCGLEQFSQTRIWNSVLVGRVRLNVPVCRLPAFFSFEPIAFQRIACAKLVYSATARNSQQRTGTSAIAVNDNQIEL